MAIESKMVGNTIIITVHQLIKSMDEVEIIEKTINTNLVRNKQLAIELHLEDAFVIPSALIETLIRHVQNRVSVTIVAKDGSFVEFIRKIKSAHALKVTKY